MYMTPISRPKNVLASARWNSVIGPPAIADRPVEQPGAVGTEQVLADQVEVVAAASSGVSSSPAIAWIIGSRL